MLKPNDDAGTRMPRAILTDGERAAVRNDANMDESTRASHLSRIRRKLRERMATDAQLLREHEPEMYDLLHETVCEGTVDMRITELETRVEALEQQLKQLDTNS